LPLCVGGRRARDLPAPVMYLIICPVAVPSSDIAAYVELDMHRIISSVAIYQEINGDHWTPIRASGGAV
jgi:hypothetical protein